MYAVTLRRFIELQLYDLGDYLKVRVCLIIFSILSISFNIGSTFFFIPNEIGPRRKQVFQASVLIQYLHLFDYL